MKRNFADSVRIEINYNTYVVINKFHKFCEQCVRLMAAYLIILAKNITSTANVSFSLEL